jgi:hypothetical protein
MSFSRSARFKDGRHRDDGKHRDGAFGLSGGMRFGGRRDGKVATFAQIMGLEEEAKEPKDEEELENDPNCAHKVCVNRPLKMEKQGDLVRLIPYKKSKQHKIPKIKDNQIQDLKNIVQNAIDTANGGRAGPYLYSSLTTAANRAKALKEIVEFQKISQENGFATPAQWQQVLEDFGIRQKVVLGEETTDYDDMKDNVMKAIKRYAEKKDENGNLKRVSLADIHYKRFINKYLKEVKKYYLENTDVTAREVYAIGTPGLVATASVGHRVDDALTTAAVLKGEGLYSAYDEGTPKNFALAMSLDADIVKSQAAASGYNATAGKFPDLKNFEMNRDVIGRQYLKDDADANKLVSLIADDKIGIWTSPKLSVFTFITAYSDDLKDIKDLIETMYDLFISQTAKFLRDPKHLGRDKKWSMVPDGGKRGMKSAHKAAPRRSGRLALKAHHKSGKPHHKSGKVAHHKSRGRGRPKSHKRH